jgi:hypothetical protein
MTTSYHKGLDVEGVGWGLTAPIPTTKAIAAMPGEERSSWFVDIGVDAMFSPRGDEYAPRMTETCIGIGKGWFRGSLHDDRTFAFRGVSVGISSIYGEAEYDHESDEGSTPQTLGVYASAGFFDAFGGGLLLRATYAKPLEFSYGDFDYSGASLCWWWGEVGGFAHGVAMAVGMVMFVSMLSGGY